jgi:hypothetical protein
MFFFVFSYSKDGVSYYQLHEKLSNVKLKMYLLYKRSEIKHIIS